MKWKAYGPSILVGVATGLVALHGCSSDDSSEGTNTDTGGSAGMGGDTATGGRDASTGGRNPTTGGNTAAGGKTATGGLGGAGGEGGALGVGGGDPLPEVDICEAPELGMGGATEPRCEVFPIECGDVDDFASARFATEDDDTVNETYNERVVVFGLGGNDIIYDSLGSCTVGGDGDDMLMFLPQEGSALVSHVGVGGPGTDRWYLGAVGAPPPVLADVESNEVITLSYSYGVNEGADGSTFVEIIEDFGGLSSELENAATRVIYDPSDGTLWSDADGSGGESSPLPLATVANADEVELSLENFRGY